MKITANRKEDIIRQRDEWEAANTRRKQEEEAEWDRFHEAEYSVLSSAQDVLEVALSDFKSLQFNINVRRRFGHEIEANIQCNENNKFNEDVALSWTYTAILEESGEIRKESGSWSGLKACTEAQMNSLKETVAALEALNSINWKSILSRTKDKLPKFSDYITDRGPREARPDFEAQLKEAELSEMVGKDIMFLGLAGENSGFRVGAPIYYMILKETPKQYVVVEQWKGGVETLKESGMSNEDIINNVKGRYPYRISKKNLIALTTYPLETIE